MITGITGQDGAYLADEIYNLAAQSHVQVFFEIPEHTANSDALGTLRLLEAIRILNLQENPDSTSELFGKVQETPQRETTPFYPRSPYADLEKSFTKDFVEQSDSIAS